ncbi:hypothetical protein PENSPDRAFT_654918 [Peniophora sp. CONT]|nr:hypothetical protein PENSPDRAFT_654918 [Peniophora sp. CONT]
MTRTRTLTVSEPATYTISLRAPQPNLDTLPTEILLQILRYAVPQPRAHRSKVDVQSLALINKAITAAHTTLLYRTVVINTHRALALLARTAAMNPRLLATHVRAFALSVDGPVSHDMLGVVVRMCSNLHTLVLPGSALQGLRVPRNVVSLPYPAPKHVTLSEWSSPHLWHVAPAPESTHIPTELLAEVTHLSIAGPPAAVWARPKEILSALGNPKALTHVLFARRTGGNETNDAEFAADCMALRACVRSVAASMCSSPVLSGMSSESHELRDALTAAGVQVRDGDANEWRAPWLTLEVGVHATSLEERFWN